MNHLNKNSINFGTLHPTSDEIDFQKVHKRRRIYRFILGIALPTFAWLAIVYMPNSVFKVIYDCPPLMLIVCFSLAIIHVIAICLIYISLRGKITLGELKKYNY